MASEAALLEEISRLSGAIDRHKTGAPKPPYRPTNRPQPRLSHRGPPHKPSHYAPSRRTGLTEYTPLARPGSSSSNPPPSKEVVIDGVTFESSGKKLVRKTYSVSASVSGSNTPSTSAPTVAPGPPASTTSLVSPPASATSSSSGKTLIRTRNALIAADRYRKPGPTTNGNHSRPRKPKSQYARVVTGYSTRAIPGRNLSLNKKPKVVKQCRHFTRTGMCSNGLTCKYQHDPAKIALCPLFILEKCPNSADACNLSHSPTPERTPLCTRFNNTGECYKGTKCLYPHIRVGPKKGVCRDFAVLGYCGKGAMCEASHLRECPDFAESGTCPRMHLKGAAKCHLPHVIRANQRRVKAPDAAPGVPEEAKANDPELAALGAWADPGPDTAMVSEAEPVATEQGAEEYISLTFEESDEDDNDNDEGEEEEDDEEVDEDQDEDEDVEEHDRQDVDPVDLAI